MTKLSKLDVFESNKLNGLADCSGGFKIATYHGGSHDDWFMDFDTQNSTMQRGQETLRGDNYGI